MANGTPMFRLIAECFAIDFTGVWLERARDPDRATLVAFLALFPLPVGHQSGKDLWMLRPVYARFRKIELVLDPVSSGEALRGMVEQTGHSGHGKQHVRNRLVGAGLDLNSAVRIVIQDEVRENVVDDFVWRFTDEVQRRIDSAVECVRQIVFVQRVVITTRDLLNVVGVLRLLGELGLLETGVVARYRRSFGGLILFWLGGHLRLPFGSRRLVVFIVG
jgi:hypothetical protein